MILDELAVKIKMIGGKESIAAMKGLHQSTLATKAAMLGLLVTFAKMSQEARRFAMNLEVFQANTGLSGKVLQEMSYQAAQAGVSLDNLGSTLQHIQKMSTQIAFGEGNIKPFQMLGIDPHQDPVKILNQVGAAIRKYQNQPAKIREIVDGFGISNELFYALLQNQTEELENQFLLKSKDQQALVKLNKEWYKVWWYVKQISIKGQGFLAHVALPIVKAVLQIVRFIGECVIAWGELTERSIALQRTLVVIGMLVAAIMAWMFPITAALIGIALVLEDIYGYFSGKDSITGRLIEWIKSGEIIKAIFLTIGEIIRKISSLIFGNKFTKTVSGLLGAVGQITNPQSTGKVTTGSGASDFLSSLSSLNPLSRFTNFASGLPSFLKPNMAGVGNNTTINQHNELTMQSSGDAVKDAQAAGAYNSESLSDAVYQSQELAYEQP